MNNRPTGETDSQWTFWADWVWAGIDLFGELLGELLSSLLNAAFDS